MARRLIAYDKKIMWLISPSGLCAFGIIPLGLSLSIPRDTYYYYAQEAYYMDSLAMIGFYVGCLFCFYFGNLMIGIAADRNLSATILSSERSSFTVTLATAVALIASGLNWMSLLTIIANSPGAITNLFAGNGDIAKETLDATGAFAQAQPLNIVASGYGLFIYLRFRNSLQSIAKIRFLAVIVFSFVTVVLTALIKVARYELIPIFVIWLVCYLFHYSLRRRMGILKMIMSALLLLFVFSLIFFSMSFFRGNKQADELIGSLIGYGPVAFNHLAAMFEGTLSFSLAGSGINAFPFLGNIPLFEGLFAIRNLLGVPDPSLAFFLEFDDTLAAGLRSAYNWVTAFGYLYIDLGQWTYLIALGMGGFARFAFASFTRGKGFGLIAYPYIASGILLFSTFNVLFRPTIITVVGLALVVALAEKVVPALYPQAPAPRPRARPGLARAKT